MDAVDGDIAPDMSAPRFFGDLTGCALEGVAQLARPEAAVGATYNLWEEQLLTAGPNQRALGNRLAGNLTTVGHLAKATLQLIGASKAILKVGDVLVDAAVGLNTATITLTPPSPAPASLPLCEGVAESQGPKQVSQCLYEAWRAGDRETALQVAWPDVVDELFSFTPGIEWEFDGCEGFTCSYVEPAPGEVHGVRINFVAAPDVDGDGRWYVGRMEILG